MANSTKSTKGSTKAKGARAPRASKGTGAPVGGVVSSDVGPGGEAPSAAPVTSKCGPTRAEVDAANKAGHAARLELCKRYGLTTGAAIRAHGIRQGP